MKMNTKEVGRFGEDLAVKFLKQNHFLILQRNWQRNVSCFLKSEIDIIARSDKNTRSGGKIFAFLFHRKQGTIHFIEVKASIAQKNTSPSGGFASGFDFFSPEQRVDFRKQRKLVKSAEAWLKQNKIALDSPWQIDIISIIISPDSDFSFHGLDFKSPDIKEPNFWEFKLPNIKLTYFQNTIGI